MVEESWSENISAFNALLHSCTLASPLVHSLTSQQPHGATYAMATAHAWLRSLINDPLSFIYQFIQLILIRVLSPTPPPPDANLGHKKIAVIGAGLTGVSSASHCVGHGFDVTIFEAGGKDALGGIWVRSLDCGTIDWGPR